MVSSIINDIRNLSRKKKFIIIGIDGVGGSGKTTLAQIIKNEMNNSVIVQMDDIYSPQLQASDITRIKNQLFSPLKNGNDAKFQIYNWKTEKLSQWQTIHPEGILIIEGVCSLDKQIIDYYDLKIWIEYPPELGFERGVQRDINGDGVDNSEKWKRVWMPLEKKYISEQNPKRKADYVINDEEISI
jgi:uridine kinase